MAFLCLGCESSDTSTATSVWDYYEPETSEWCGTWISTREHAIDSSRKSMPMEVDEAGKMPGDSMAILMRGTYRLSEIPDSAIIRLVGLGYYELYLNGQRVGTQVLDPAFSDYQRTVHARSFRVDTLLREGENAIGVRLGGGFYNYPSANFIQFSQSGWRAPNKLLAQVDLFMPFGKKTNWCTDESWVWDTSAIVYNSVQSGETVDARLVQPDWNQPEFDDSDWTPVVTVEGPGGVIRPQIMPPLRVTDSLQPESIQRLDTGTWLVDFGENLTGWVTLKIRNADPGQQIRVFYNEQLLDDGYLHKRHSATHVSGRFQEGRYLAAGGEEEVFDSRFSYYGFRFVQIEGLSQYLEPGDVVAKKVHTDLAFAGTFTCSNPRLNDLQAAVRRTLLNSIHGMPGEEPTREKAGWTLDAGLITMDAYLYNFDAAKTYETYLQHLIDAQEPSGHIPPIVPTNGWGYLNPETGQPIQYDDPWWGGTLFWVAWRLYEWTGDPIHLEHAFTPMENYLNFVAGTSDEAGFVHWSLGDWLDPDQFRNGWGPGWTPIVQTSTLAYGWMAKTLGHTAHVLNKPKDANRYHQLADSIYQGFNDRFLDPETGWYRDSSQTAQAMPLWLGIVPDSLQDRVVGRFLEAIEMRNGHIFAGFLGVQPILMWLSENGYIDRVYKMVTKETSPGWLHMVEDDRSTLGENMNAAGYGTGHHPFGTNMGHWFYHYLGGISPGSEGRGWKNFQYAPKVPANLESVSVTYDSPNGSIRSGWINRGDTLQFSLEVPERSRANASLAGTEIIRITYNERSVPSVLRQNGKYFTGILKPGRYEIYVLP